MLTFLFLLPILCALYIYRLIVNRYDFWKNLGIPFERPSFPFGNTKNTILGKCHISTDIDRLYRSYATEPYVGYFEFFRPNLLIRDRQLIERVMVKDFNYFHDRGVVIDEKLDPCEAHLNNLNGHRWKMVRSKITPAFSVGKLKSMTAIIEECAKDLNEHMNGYADSGLPIDVRETMGKFTTDVIGRCGFGLDFNSLRNANSDYRTIGKKMMIPTVREVAKKFVGMFDPYILIRLKIKQTPTYVEEFFTDLFRSVMNYRKRHNVHRNDFMQMMIDLHDREISDRYRRRNDKRETKPNDNNHDNGDGDGDDKDLQFTDNLLTANVLMFYIAGFETTASTLAYLLYELAMNPDVQDKLRAEIKSVVGKHDGTINYDVLHDMKYMNTVISETLRKYNPSGITGREVTKDYPIPGTSIILPAKTRISISINSLHHDPKYYPEPDRFIPERFSDENIANRPSHTFLPFGDGPRNCIGLKFAKLEVKCCLTYIVPKYRFDICKETIIPIRLQSRPMLQTPSHDITLMISKIIDS